MDAKEELIEVRRLAVLHNAASQPKTNSSREPLQASLSHFDTASPTEARQSARTDHDWKPLKLRSAARPRNMLPFVSAHGRNAIGLACCTGPDACTTLCETSRFAARRALIGDWERGRSANSVLATNLFAARKDADCPGPRPPAHVDRSYQCRRSCEALPTRTQSDASSSSSSSE